MIAGVIQGIIFLIYTSFSRRGRDKSMIYLNLVVLSLTLNNIQIPIIDNFFSSTNFFIDNLHITFYVLTVPSFYAFLVHFLKIENKINDYFALGLGLFVLECALRVVFYFNYFNQDKSVFIGQYAQIEEITNAVFCLILFSRAAILVFNQSKLYPFVLTFDKIKWLKTFVLLGGLVLVFWVFAIALNVKNVINQEIYFYYPLRLSSSVLLYWIGYQGFRRYTMMSDRMEIRNFIQSENQNNSAPFDVSNTKKIVGKLSEVDKHLLQTQSFMRPETTIKTLANELGVSDRTLSKIVKEKSNLNFPDYINSFRIAKAKEFLKDETYAGYTVEAIGLECGFNSKSTFYSAFKKITGMTPLDFRKE